MTKLTSYIKKMSSWWFISFFSLFTVSITTSFLVVLNYSFQGLLDPKTLFTGIIASSITAVVIVFIAGIVFKQLRIEDKELQLGARVFSNAHEGIIIADMDNKIVDVNPTLSHITEYSHDELIGQTTDILISNSNKNKFYLDIWRSLAKHGHWKGEIWSRKKGGQLFIGHLTISTLLVDDGETLHYVCLVSDMTQSMEQQKKLEFMAHYDVLTKLPNRGFFAECFEKAVDHADRYASLLAICFIDLDDFKPINDNFGHVVGDKLLIEVAQRIQANIRNEDTVSRLGGDEFSLLLGDIHSNAECEQLLRRIHSTLSQPYVIEDKTILISASIGVTIYPDDTSDPDTLLRHADQAMYKAKLAGRNNYQFFNAEDDQLAIKKQHCQQEIQGALLRDEFCLHYQPKINMKTGEIFGAEALIRWQHPSKGLLQPIEFLPTIEGTDLEIQLGNWVIKTAVKQMDTWKAVGLEIETSINISSHHLQSVHFFGQVSSALEKHPNVDSKFLQLEILESSVLNDINTISTIINTCRDELGVCIALDDFGTGYSSLNHLRHLMAKTVKIDRSFVINMLDNPNDHAIVDGVISLADTFHREVIAEGVETIEHGLMLLIMGCELAQGFGISPPMPADEFVQWQKNFTPFEQWASYSDDGYSIENRHQTLFKLSTNQWVKRFKRNITAAPEDIMYWPIMKHNKCPCGSWIKRSKKENIFDSHQIDTIDQAHKDMHQLAAELKDRYLGGEIKEARQKLHQLETSLEELINLNEPPNSP